MVSPTEEFARVVARKLAASGARDRNRTRRADIPTMDVLTELFDLLFFASIKTEEARPVSVRVFYVDPQDPDPAAPPRIRIDRWRIFRLSQPVPLTVANLVKLAKAADPWASGLAVFHHNGGGLFVWGMVDQVVHISMALVQENSGSYPPPGIFHAMINGAADISVFKQNSFIARLSQDTTYRYAKRLSLGRAHQRTTRKLG